MKNFSKKDSGPKSGAFRLDNELTDFKGQMHQNILMQILIKLTIYVTVVSDKRFIQVNDFLKIIMIACNSTLQGDSELLFIH